MTLTWLQVYTFNEQLSIVYVEMLEVHPAYIILQIEAFVTKCVQSLYTETLCWSANHFTPLYILFVHPSVVEGKIQSLEYFSFCCYFRTTYFILFNEPIHT